MTQPDIVVATTPVIEALEDLKIRYYIGGSLASSAHGMPRTTLDVDLVADLRPEHVQPLIHRLEDAYYVDRSMIRDAIRNRSSFNLIHLNTVFKVDVFVLKEDPFDRQALQRARGGRLRPEQGGRDFFLASPEDVTLHKLRWYRTAGGNSERQWSDVVGVLKVQRDALDLPYLRHWAERLQVLDLLEQAMRDAGLPMPE